MALRFLCLALCIAVSVAQFQKASLDLHNKYRKCHGASPLSLTDALNKDAQRCADYLASIKQMAHVCNQKFGTSYGENLASGSGGDWATNATAASLRSTKMWYDEQSQHDHNNNNFNYATGHFTQVVWKGSKELGMGYATNGGFTIVVGHYNPPGNYQGQFVANVGRKTC